MGTPTCGDLGQPWMLSFRHHLHIIYRQGTHQIGHLASKTQGIPVSHFPVLRYQVVLQQIAEC